MNPGMKSAVVSALKRVDAQRWNQFRMKETSPGFSWRGMYFAPVENDFMFHLGDGDLLGVETIESGFKGVLYSRAYFLLGPTRNSREGAVEFLLEQLRRDSGFRESEKA